jgi:hypothetical protein
VTELEAVEEAEFGKALLMSDRLKIPCSPATPTPSAELRSRAACHMYQDGLAKALLGETPLEEVFRIAL